MHRFLFAMGVFTLAACPVLAEEPKAGEIKKQIAETEALLAKKKAELAKTQAALKAAQDEYELVKGLGPARLQEADTITKLMTEAPQRKLTEARLAAEKAALDAITAVLDASTLS